MGNTPRYSIPFFRIRKIISLIFGDRESEKIFNLVFSRKLPRDIQERAYHKLIAIHEAESLENLRQPPGIRLEALS